MTLYAPVMAEELKTQYLEVKHSDCLLHEQKFLKKALEEKKLLLVFAERNDFYERFRTLPIEDLGLKHLLISQSPVFVSHRFEFRIDGKTKVLKDHSGDADAKPTEQ